MAQKNTLASFLKRVCFFLVLLLVISCRKDPPFNDCTDIPPWSGAGIGYKYHFSPHFYSDPEFNPNNPDEIVYYSKSKLYKFNLATNEKTLVFEGALWYQTSWGINDWILLSRAGNTIWKIKPNGDSLTQLTFEESYNPKWNMDASKFKYQYWSGVVIKNEDNTLYDTIHSNGDGNWNQSLSLIAAAPGIKNVGSGQFKHGVKVVDSETGQNIYTYYLPYPSANANTGGGQIWLKDGQSIIWSNYQGIFTTNYIANSTKKIGNTCKSRYYIDPTYSPQRDQIIWNRIQQNLLDKDNIYIESSLVIMNSDGTNEREIIIPE